MSEEKKGNSLFWLALLILGGGAAWAINKYIVAPKKDTTKDNGGSKGNDTNANSGTQNPSGGSTGTPNPSVSVNDATKVGYPYSIDIKKIITKSNKFGGKDYSYSYNDYNNIPVEIASGEVRQDGIYLSGQPIGQAGYWYIYDKKDGSFIEKYKTVLHDSEMVNIHQEAFVGFF